VDCKQQTSRLQRLQSLRAQRRIFMKKSYWIIAVLALAFAGDRLGGWILGKITRESQFRYSRLYRGGADYEILLAGNSRGLIFYQPYIEEKLGVSTLNLSYNGMPISLASVLIEDQLDQQTLPRLLLLDVSMLDKRMDEKLISSFNPYTPYSGRLSQLMQDSSTNDFYAGKISQLYRHNGEVFQRALFYWKKSDEDWLLDRVISTTMQSAVEKQKEFRFDFDEKMLATLAGTVNYARQKGVRVELVLNPYYPPFVGKISNLEELKSKVEKATGQQVHDYSTSIADVEGFGDYQHLNKVGAKLFIDKLIADSIFIEINLNK
jgi:hypothetical protein